MSSQVSVSGASRPGGGRVGISHAGARVEELFRQITGAAPPVRKVDGDAVFAGHNVEVKKASDETINQVRAVKYSTLVVFHEASGSWFVVPAPDVVRLVAQKQRGQHTENPFESATLRVSNLDEFKVASEQSLSLAVKAAIVRGKKFPDVEAAMCRVLSDAQQLAESSRRDVVDLLNNLGV